MITRRAIMINVDMMCCCSCDCCKNNIMAYLCMSPYLNIPA